MLIQNPITKHLPLAPPNPGNGEGRQLITQNPGTPPPRFKIKLPDCITSADWNNPRFVLLLTIITYLGFVMIRFLIFSLFSEAGALGDDYGYKGAALSFFKTGEPYKLNYARKLMLPNYLYPLVISPAFFIMEHFYIFIKLINSFLINAAIFPIYFTAREFMSTKKAYFTAGITLLIPFMNFGYITMCEALYLPLFLLAFYWSYKLLKGLEPKYAVLSGITLALLYLTKPNGLFFLAALLLTTILLFFLADEKNQKKQIFYLTAVTLAIAFLAVIVLNLLVLGNTGLNLKHYTAVAKRNTGLGNLDLLFQPKLIYLMLSHISLFWLWYLLPFFVLVFSLKKAIKEKIKERQILLLLALSFSLVMAGVTLFLALNAPTFLRDLRLPSRFYFMIYPVYIIAFAAFYREIDWNKKQKIIIAVSFAITLLINIFIFIPKIVLAKKGFAMIPNFDAVWIYISQQKWHTMGTLLFILVHLLGLAVVVYYLFHRKKNLYPYIAFFLILIAISHWGLFVEMARINNRMLNFREKYLLFVEEKIPAHSADVALISRKPWFKQGYFSFWLHYDYTAKLELAEHTTITKDMIPADTRWVLVEGKFPVGFPVKACYQKGGYMILEMPGIHRPPPGRGRRRICYKCPSGEYFKVEPQKCTK